MFGVSVPLLLLRKCCDDCVHPNRSAACPGTSSLQCFSVQCLVTLMQRRETFNLSMISVFSSKLCVFKHASAAQRVLLIISTNNVFVF